MIVTLLLKGEFLYNKGIPVFIYLFADVFEVRSQSRRIHLRSFHQISDLLSLFT